MNKYVYVAVVVGTQVDWDSDIVYRFVDNVAGVYDSYERALTAKHCIQGGTVYILRKEMNCSNTSCHYRLYEE